MEQESRTQKLLKNAIFAALYQGINALCGMITPRFILLAYGSNINGLISSINQFLTCFALLEAGLAMASQHALYKPLAEKDHSKTSAIVSATRIAYNQVGYVFSALSIILAFLYPVFTHVEDLSYGLVVALALVLAAYTVLSYFTVAKYQVLFQADQKVWVISMAKIVVRIISTVCIVAMAINKVHFLLPRIAITGSVIIQALIIGLYAKKHYPYIDYKAKPDNSALSQRWDALFLQFLGSIQVSAPGIILTLFATLKHVSVFAVYNMIFSALMNLLSIFMNGVNASFGNLLQSNNRKKIQAVFSEFENAYYVLITIIYIVAGIMILPFIRIYTAEITDANYLMPYVGIMFAADGFIYNLKTPHGMMVQAAGLFRRTRAQNAIEAAILLFGGLILGYFFGIYGVLAASLLSNLYRAIILIIFVPHHITKGSVLRSARKVVLMSVCFVSITFAGDSIFKNITIDNFFQWFVAAFIVFILTSIIVIVADFIFQRRDMIRFAKRIIGMIKSKVKAH